MKLNLQILVLCIVIGLSINFQTTQSSEKTMEQIINEKQVIKNISLDRGFKMYDANQLKQEGEIPSLKKVSKDILPDNFNWGNVDNVNYLTVVMSQFSPQYCNSDYALSVASALSDRIKIMRNAQWPDIYIASQVLLSCSTQNQGCLGGNDLNAYSDIYDNFITDYTCSNYQGKGIEQGIGCTDEIICGDCVRNKSCTPVEKYDKYHLLGYGSVKGEEDMMNEIFYRGPITCPIQNTVELENYKGGIFKPTVQQNKQDFTFNHVVSIVGWGEDESDGSKYWMVRNTNGEFWGERGYFRIERGSNSLGIETECHFGVVKDNWGNRYEEMIEQTQFELRKGSKFNTSQFMEYFMNEQELKDNIISSQESTIQFQEDKGTQKEGEMHYNKKSEPAYKSINADILPENWDWRNVEGTNYMTWTVNQHIPIYCGSCWAQATMSSMADRYNIQREAQFPQTVLSPQVAVNCGMGGTCGGGDKVQLLQDIHDQGIPVQTCQVYVSQNDSVFECTPFKQCNFCYPTEYGVQACQAAENYWEVPKIYVEEHGQLPNDVDAIKAEIYARGPVQCSMYSTDMFHDYVGGIYKQYIYGLDLIDTNHVIQLLGWGVDESGEEYWIARNSWGTYWGESGFYKITTDNRFNLATTRTCVWGVPTDKKPE